MNKPSTEIRHKAIYERYCKLEKEARNNGIYHHIYLTSIYCQVGEEVGYGERYVGRIVARYRKKEQGQ